MWEPNSKIHSIPLKRKPNPFRNVFSVLFFFSNKKNSFIPSAVDVSVKFYIPFNANEKRHTVTPNNICSLYLKWFSITCCSRSCWIESLSSLALLLFSMISRSDDETMPFIQQTLDIMMFLVHGNDYTKAFAKCYYICERLPG